VAVALMVINVLGYVSLGSIECVLVLGGAAYLANQFTQNRTVDIFIGLFVSNILFGCGRLREGFEGVDKTLGKVSSALGQKKKEKECDAAKCHEGCDEQDECLKKASAAEIAKAHVDAAAVSAKAAE